jgi:hypothetical protein
MRHKENEAFSTSIYEIDHILQERADEDQEDKGEGSDKAK